MVGAECGGRGYALIPALQRLARQAEDEVGVDFQTLQSTGLTDRFASLASVMLSQTTAFIASLVPFFLVNDLLLLNQFPDAEADATVGRRHMLVVAGSRASSVVYGLFLLAAYLSLTVGVSLDLLPALSLLGLLTLFLAVPVALGVYRHAGDLEKLMPYLGRNVLINIVTPVLAAIGLFIAA